MSLRKRNGLESNKRSLRDMPSQNGLRTSLNPIYSDHRWAREVGRILSESHLKMIRQEIPEEKLAPQPLHVGKVGEWVPAHGPFLYGMVHYFGLLRCSVCIGVNIPII